MPQRCEHCRKEGATKRCVKCTTCFYCDRECQTKNWKKMHKRVCSEDPSIKPHVPIEMAVERALKRLPSQRTAPADAACYICLDHDSKLVRGCACRGDSAGFVHLECLIALAERKEENSVGLCFYQCINCKQAFTGALFLQLVRHMWRRLRDESLESRLASCHLLGDLLEKHGEEDGRKRIMDALSKSPQSAGILKLNVAERMAKERPEEGQLKLVEEVLSQARQDGDAAMTINAQSQYVRELHRLERYEENVAMATECLEFVNGYRATHCDHSDPALIERKYDALSLLAFACGMTGRFDESRRTFDGLLVSVTRIYGREHGKTHTYFRLRAILLWKMVMKAHDLVNNDDRANGVRYLDAVLIASKAQNFLDAKDPNVKTTCHTMEVAGHVLGKIGRTDECLAVVRLILKLLRECAALDSKWSQEFMWSYANDSLDLHGPTEETKQVLHELLAIQTRLYGPDGPEAQATANLLSNLTLSHINDAPRKGPLGLTQSGKGGRTKVGPLFFFLFFLLYIIYKY